MRFPTIWYVPPAKPQISLRIHAVWSEPLLFAAVVPKSPCHTKLRCHYIGTELFNFPEGYEIGRKCWYFSWKGPVTASLQSPCNEHGVATELAWHSIVFLWSSFWQFSALLRCLYCAFTALTVCALWFHGVHTVLTVYWRHSTWHVKERCTISMQTTIAFAQQPLREPVTAFVVSMLKAVLRPSMQFPLRLTGNATALLQRCLRFYCAHLCNFCTFHGHFGIAVRTLLLGVIWV